MAASKKIAIVMRRTELGIKTFEVIVRTKTFVIIIKN